MIRFLLDRKKTTLKSWGIREGHTAPARINYIKKACHEWKECGLLKISINGRDLCGSVSTSKSQVLSGVKRFRRDRKLEISKKKIWYGYHEIRSEAK